VDALAGPGYVEIPNYAGAQTVLGLRSARDQRQRLGQFRPAAVGGGINRSARPNVRGDSIAWVDHPVGEVETSFFARLEQLRVASNRSLMAGLESLEMHFASFPSGSGYARHIDQSPMGVDRVLSVIYYLNPDWQLGDGGELAIDTTDGTVLIKPIADTLVVFLSEKFAHQVLPAVRERHSMAGWFLRRPMGRLG
jgi:SM-20-related protein